MRAVGENSSLWRGQHTPQNGPANCAGNSPTAPLIPTQMFFAAESFFLQYFVRVHLTILPILYCFFILPSSSITRMYPPPETARDWMES